MGPILQEQAPTAFKRVPGKDKVRSKNAENAGAVNTSSKKGAKLNLNQKPQKKIVTSCKSDQESCPKTHKGQQHGGNRSKSDLSPLTSNRKVPRATSEADIRSQQQKRPQMVGPEERRHKVVPLPFNSSEVDRNQGAAQTKNRRDLSLPLAPQAVLQHRALQRQQQTTALESLHYFQPKEDDTDSASDLSDSERLPVLPSPCTPPQLNLRAEIINSVDLLPDIPRPRVEMTDNDVEGDSYSYPDFLPPPFNTWSLRQLAIFLNTEGKGAPRPRPVGQLEKYLERLLQLEWHQIQTIQMENGRAAPPSLRSRGLQATGTVSGSSAGGPRPHTAPPTRLNSPKSVRQNQRGLPFAVISSLTSPSSTQVSRPICPYCHIRYPLCNGTCCSYAYHRHSRVSPLLERKAVPGTSHGPSPAPVPAFTHSQKRSNSESRATTSDSKLNNRGQRDPGSPKGPKSHLRHIQATGNMRRPSLDAGATSKPVMAFGRKCRGGKVSETDRPRENAGAKSFPEKRTPPASKQEVSLGKRCERDRQGAESGWVKSGARRPENCPPSKKPSASRPNGKTKSGKCVVK